MCESGVNRRARPVPGYLAAMADRETLTVAVTGPTGTFGFGLLPLLQAEPGVGRVVGIARRPFDPRGHGWTKMDYRRGDVRDPAALREAFRDVDVVVHLAFLVIGGSEETTRAVNVEGTLNTVRAAADAGVRRFVYASSVAAYGFHADNPVGMDEQWPVRPAQRLFYARQKAELEHLLRDEARAHPDTALYLLRPPVVLGPHALGAKDLLPAPLARLAPLARRLYDATGRLPLPVPVAVPDMPVQFVHEEDVGRALLQCVLGAGPPGAYNIAGDGVLSTLDVARELGVRPVPVPALPARAAARTLLRVPFLPRAAGWLEVASRPAIMDTTRARTQLGWRPRYSALEALRDTLSR
jgi:nucleoside-diphosphate-sugar epimerase